MSDYQEAETLAETYDNQEVLIKEEATTEDVIAEQVMSEAVSNQEFEEPVSLDTLMEKCKNDDDDEIMLFHAQELCEEDLISLIEAQTAVSKVYQGQVKSFSAKTGYGFLNTDGSDEDIFVHASQISSDSQEPNLDDKQVEYLMTKNESGKPVAIQVTDIGGGLLDETSAEIQQKYNEMNEISSSLIESWTVVGERIIRPGDEEWPSSIVNIGGIEAELLQDPDKTYKGNCKWFRRDTGLVSMSPGEDGTRPIDYLLSIKKSDIKAASGVQRLTPGQAVEFKLAISTANRLLAIDVTGPNGTEINAPPPSSGRSRNAEYNPTCLGDKGIKSGVVLWFDAKKQYGFITPDDDGENYFVHASEIRARDPKRLAGQKVQFKVGQLSDGKMVAMNVSGTALLRTGTILWFDPKKKYGFVTPSAGGDNVFVHGSEILARDFSNLNNEKVEYRMGKLKDGKDVAVEVTGPYGQMLPIQRIPPPGEWDRPRRGPAPWGPPPPPGWGSRGPPPPPRGPPRRWSEGPRESRPGGWGGRADGMGPRDNYNMRGRGRRSPPKNRGRPGFDDYYAAKRPRW